MKHTLFFFILILGFSCNSKDQWVDDLNNSVKAYNKNAELEEKEYLVDSGTSTAIFVAPYKEQNGLRKTVFRHMRTEIMYFERHIFFEGDDIVYEHHMGIAPRLVNEGLGVKASNYLIFNKQSFFKDDAVGKQYRQQKLVEEFVGKDSVLPIVQNLDIEESFLYHEDYLEIKNYLKDIEALERIEE
ncbi:hypothetical protein J0X14_05245 [Muricauda sp. CAU 1633]|uniref:hypothetical protein n=1 Tax=Allomuricauda sp. CAU 1633 TaxID=2816036 RepID=UPI001A8F7634|nr:hypothetical protein [Muricauda sp. CAU 1633]MBO0321691.1 hypothetical protein [Muricauda sp. CAU 1633]